MVFDVLAKVMVLDKLFIKWFLLEIKLYMPIYEDNTLCQVALGEVSKDIWSSSFPSDIVYYED